MTIEKLLGGERWYRNESAKWGRVSLLYIEAGRPFDAYRCASLAYHFARRCQALRLRLRYGYGMEGGNHHVSVSV